MKPAGKGHNLIQQARFPEGGVAEIDGGLTPKKGPTRNPSIPNQFRAMPVFSPMVSGRKK